MCCETYHVLLNDDLLQSHRITREIAAFDQNASQRNQVSIRRNLENDINRTIIRTILFTVIP